MKQLEVVAAIIIYNHRILCMQRDAGRYDYVSYKFEFPGGKIEPGETQCQALIRELKEELDIKVTIHEEDFFMTVNHQYPDFEIKMHSYLCHVDSDYFVRKEHFDHKWLFKEELHTLDWAQADRPIVLKLEGTEIL